MPRSQSLPTIDPNQPQNPQGVQQAPDAAGTDVQRKPAGVRGLPAATYAEGAAGLKPGVGAAARDGKPKGAAAAPLGPRRVKTPLNLRRAPGTHAPIQRVLPTSALVHTFDDKAEVDGYSWVYVQVGGLGGYVADRYLADAATSATDAGPGQEGAAATGAAALDTRVVRGNLRLHSQAGLSAPVLRMLLRGSLVKTFADHRTVDGMHWILVEFQGMRGYVAENYLRTWTPQDAREPQTDATPGAVTTTVQPAPVKPAPRPAPAATTPNAGTPTSGVPTTGAPTRGAGTQGTRMALAQAPLRKQPDDRSKTPVVVPRGATLELSGATGGKVAGSWVEVRYTIDRASGTVDSGWMQASEVGAPDAQIASRYRSQYEQAKVNTAGPVTGSMLTREARVILTNKARYVQVSAKTGLPWYVIGLIHMREAGFNFKTYLHNGDPLGKPTTHVPKGILFDNWEDAAINAIEREQGKFTRGILEGMEAYNGTGYRARGIASPYLWSGTTEYQKGKYVADGKFDANVVDRQAGVAGVLRSLEALGVQIDHASL